MATPIHLLQGQRCYPEPPYGSNPLVILYPPPAHDFGSDEPSAGKRVGGVVGFDAEQNRMMGGTREPIGPTWLKDKNDTDVVGPVKWRKGKPVARNAHTKDDLVEGLASFNGTDDDVGDDHPTRDHPTGDDVLEDPHHNLTVKDIDEIDVEGADGTQR